MDKYEVALEALRSLDPGGKPNISLFARTYSVDASNLRRRFLRLTGPKQVQYDNQRVLNHGQSQAFIKYINQLTEKGLPPTNRMLANFAEDICGKKPGKNWATRCLKSHSDQLISRYSTGLDMDRKNADKAWKYVLYFELLGRKIMQYNLASEQIYNMDEKGFMLGMMIKEKRIFSRYKYELGGFKQFLQDGNREWITTIACICADGKAISPSLIYSAKSGNIQDSWLQDFDPKAQRCFFAASESGWTNNDIGYHWLVDVFDKETKSQASRGWRLLILDAHATHTLQPLDVASFSPLSQAYSNELNSFLAECQGSRLTKRDVFRLFLGSLGSHLLQSEISDLPSKILVYILSIQHTGDATTPSNGAFIWRKSWGGTEMRCCGRTTQRVLKCARRAFESNQLPFDMCRARASLAQTLINPSSITLMELTTFSNLSHKWHISYNVLKLVYTGPLVPENDYGANNAMLVVNRKHEASGPSSYTQSPPGVGSTPGAGIDQMPHFQLPPELLIDWPWPLLL
ncbi:conserved hypothetical protein [Talaromyces stipitatus ATCC 10500]|uniref:HTH CENPB-type domain-containing protein n=1 Tax=Talaromyces stipitatus (strain ATCC 10500 / CBS 375.48 / QM 6759 / NRRL 1006) TaxID=441959 RepID=B8ML63_TALSN|nr:uncharacterized protein TSTA_044440 [Talaromyces stipitatus ATCC 10500]EED14978.1 conserved hypothetical protein [Talaromyces stipitatus ATCC 10500]